MKSTDLTPISAPLASLLIAVSLCAATLVWAGDLEDGEAAYSRGDYATAIRLYRAAADQNDADAQVNLGMMYAEGIGVPGSDQEAVEWFRKAADQGNGAGQSALGLMYGLGRGVAKNEQTAYFWLLLAAAQGEKSARRSIYIAEQGLTPEQRANAQADANNWKPVRKASD